MKRLPIRRLLDWLPVAGLCAAIFVQSCFATPDLGPAFPLKDKLLHMAAYGTLAVFVYRACRLTWPDRLSPALLLTISIGFAMLYGLSDEIHQAFVKARQADAGDWIADGVGAVLGAAGYSIVQSKRRGNEIRSHQKRDGDAESAKGDGAATHSQ